MTATLLLASLAIGIVRGVWSEHRRGAAWFKVGADMLLLACPIYFVLVFLLMFKAPAEKRPPSCWPSCPCPWR